MIFDVTRYYLIYIDCSLLERLLATTFVHLFFLCASLPDSSSKACQYCGVCGLWTAHSTILTTEDISLRRFALSRVAHSTILTTEDISLRRLALSRVAHSTILTTEAISLRCLTFSRVE